MRIAIIGWGSLIWLPDSLRISTKWRSDGPVLPLEFARISRDGRLTIVIHPDSPEVRTYWAISACETLEEARENLRQREGTVITHVAMARVKETDTAARSAAGIAILAWLKSQRDVEAAVWTALSSNWEDKRRRPFSPADAVRYLSELERDRHKAPLPYERACEYIRNAPEQLQTEVRKLLQKQQDLKTATRSAFSFEQTPDECQRGAAE